MLTALLIGLGLLMALAIGIATRPAEFRVSRSAIIPASPEVVFPMIADLRNWDAWSPWAKLDPNARATFEGAESGVGQAFAWTGNNKIGAGRMTILESRPNDLVRLRLDFEKPMKATNETVFTFTPQKDGTSVSWTMTGRNSFMSKAVNLVINCDKMVGGQFEQGLSNLRQVTAGTASRQPLG